MNAQQAWELANASRAAHREEKRQAMQLKWNRSQLLAEIEVEARQGRTSMKVKCSEDDTRYIRELLGPDGYRVEYRRGHVGFVPSGAWI